MKTLLLATAAALALSSASALATSDNYTNEQLFANGTDGNATASVTLVDYVYGDVIDYSYVDVLLVEDGVATLHCNGGNPPLGGNYDVLSIVGSGKSATGDVGEFVDLMACYFGSLDTLTVQCEWDEDFYQRSVGNIQVINSGERFSYRGNTVYATADCDVEINGTTYSLDFGNLYLGKGS